jgi:outer membrane protein OmpA-like peptidoglycan-associated protein
VKGFILFARYCLCFIFAVPSPAEAQETNSYSDYVVIGAFSKHKNAIRFTSDANQNNFPAKYEINPNRKLFYVYVLATSDHQIAVEQALKLRTESKYFDTWVYSGPLGELQDGRGSFQSRDINPATGEKIDVVRPDEDNVIDAKTTIQSKPGVSNGDRSLSQQTTSTTYQQSSTPDRHPSSGRGETLKNAPPPQNDLQEKMTADGKKINRPGDSSEGEVRQQVHTSTGEGNDKKNDNATSSRENQATPVVGNELPKRANEEPLTAQEIVGKAFFFSLFRADNHRPVEGEVDAVDFEKSRKMATYTANVPVKVMLPAGKSKQMSFVCHVFGYRKLQKEFDPANPSDELYLDESGSLVVPFELVRLQKGDIAIMYNVYFFKDAAVMRPESRYEVNNLLELLVENPGYRIRIHGHTNGNATGKIIRMGKPGNFYSLSETKDGFGSAKKLSEERALIIREYLVSSGIALDRMEIKAWGGKKPLFDKNSVRAVENVRVEIEILSE